MTLNGWLILDKSSAISSAYAVGRVKRLLKPGKIGHAGTLDPLASGVLPLALGEATKTVAYMMDGEKAYEFTVTWGEERDTDDSEGKPVATSPARPCHEDINNILQQFIGNISQTPPNYSAIKIDGKRAYDMARSGETVEMKSRQVTVHSLEITDCNDISASFLCHCGKGTYIRSLARDMGRLLGCYGYISRLRRIKVGKFSENHAISLETLTEMVHKGDLGFLKPVESALDDIPARNVNSDQAALLKRGIAIVLPPHNEEEPDGTKVLARSDGKAIAICEMARGTMKPVRVFNL